MAPNSATLLLWFAVIAFSTQTINAQSRAVDLSDAFSTEIQDGFQRVYTGRYVDGELIETDCARDLAEIEKLRTGASNAFLVDATNLTDAMNASRRVLAGYGPADRAVPARSPKAARGSHWLVVYLGSGHSTPPKWTVEGVAVDRNRVQLTYRHPKAGFQTLDIRPYYYWIPLGTLTPGTYNVGLYDSEIKAVTFTRRVVVE